MSGYYIGLNGYYEGDKQSPSDQDVPQRPSSRHVFSDGAWVIGPNSSEQTKEELRRISDALMASGGWETTLYAAMRVNISEARQKYPVQTAPLTDDQIIAAVTDSESPFYNQNAAKAYQYYIQIKEIS